MLISWRCNHRQGWKPKSLKETHAYCLGRCLSSGQSRVNSSATVGMTLGDNPRYFMNEHPLTYAANPHT